METLPESIEPVSQAVLDARAKQEITRRWEKGMKLGTKIKALFILGMMALGFGGGCADVAVGLSSADKQATDAAATATADNMGQPEDAIQTPIATPVIEIFPTPTPTDFQPGPTDTKIVEPTPVIINPTATEAQAMVQVEAPIHLEGREIFTLIDARVVMDDKTKELLKIPGKEVVYDENRLGIMFELIAALRSQSINWSEFIKMDNNQVESLLAAYRIQLQNGQGKDITMPDTAVLKTNEEDPTKVNTIDANLDFGASLFFVSERDPSLIGGVHYINRLGFSGMGTGGMEIILFAPERAQRPTAEGDDGKWLTYLVQYPFVTSLSQVSGDAFSGAGKHPYYDRDSKTGLYDPADIKEMAARMPELLAHILWGEDLDNPVPLISAK